MKNTFYNMVITANLYYLLNTLPIIQKQQHNKTPDSIIAFEKHNCIFRGFLYFQERNMGIEIWI